MRTFKTGLVAALALGGLLALTNVVSAQDAKEGGKKRGFGTPEQQLEQWTKELTLTDAQKPKVKAVLEDSAKKRADLQNVDQSERREKMRGMMEDQNTNKLSRTRPGPMSTSRAGRRGPRSGVIGA